MSVRVLHRSGQWCPGLQRGEVVAYDVQILPEYQVAGRPTVDRSYLLLDEGVQLTKPAVFEGPVEGWWYVDLVEIERTDTGLVVHDLYVDFLIPPAVDRYQILDLDELSARPPSSRRPTSRPWNSSRLSKGSAPASTGHT